MNLLCTLENHFCLFLWKIIIIFGPCSMMTYVFTALRSTQITEAKITLGNPPECLFCMQASSIQNEAPFFFSSHKSITLGLKLIGGRVRFRYTALMIKKKANFNIQLLTLKTILALMCIKLFFPL